MTSTVVSSSTTNAVQLTNKPKAVKDCKLVQELSATADSASVATMREQVIADIKNQADNLSATHVLTAGPQVEKPGQEVTITGEAYRCD